MNALQSLFPLFMTTETIYTLLSVGCAAVVFFYFIFLLRKEESDEAPVQQQPESKIRVIFHRQH